jgi:glc operon protein GlcG
MSSMRQCLQMSGAALCGLALLITAATGQQSAGQTPSGSPVAPPNGTPFDIPFGTPISVERAKQIAAAAIAMAKQHDWKMSVAVVEPSGDLIYFEKMDGAAYSTPASAMGKARTAAIFRRPTKVFMDAVNSGNASLLGLPGVVPSEGGFPLVEQGKLIGGVGAAGGMTTQDAATARAGAETLK